MLEFYRGTLRDDRMHVSVTPVMDAPFAFGVQVQMNAGDDHLWLDTFDFADAVVRGGAGDDVLYLLEDDVPDLDQSMFKGADDSRHWHFEVEHGTLDIRGFETIRIIEGCD